MKVLKGIPLIILFYVSILGLTQAVEAKENPAVQVEGK